MSRRNSSGPRTGIVFIMMLAAATGLGVLAAYVRSTPSAAHVSGASRRVDPSVHTVKSSGDDEEAPKRSSVDQVKIAVANGDDVVLSPDPRPVPTGQDKLTFAANEVLKGFGHPDARILAVTLEGSVAHLQCNSKAATGWGSMEEGQFVKAIQLTFGQFSSVDRVEFYLDGQKLDTLGHFEIQDGVDVAR